MAVPIQSRKTFEYEGHFVPAGEEYFRRKRIRHISDGHTFIRHKDDESIYLGMDEGVEDSFYVWYNNANKEDACRQFVEHYNKMISELEKKVQKYQDYITYLEES